MERSLWNPLCKVSALQGDCRRKRREIHRAAMRLHSLRSVEPLWRRESTTPFLSYSILHLSLIRCCHAFTEEFPVIVKLFTFKSQTRHALIVTKLHNNNNNNNTFPTSLKHKKNAKRDEILRQIGELVSVSMQLTGTSCF